MRFTFSSHLNRMIVPSSTQDLFSPITRKVLRLIMTGFLSTPATRIGPIVGDIKAVKEPRCQFRCSHMGNDQGAYMHGTFRERISGRCDIEPWSWADLILLICILAYTNDLGIFIQPVFMSPSRDVNCSITVDYPTERVRSHYETQSNRRNRTKTPVKTQTLLPSLASIFQNRMV